LKSRLLSIIQHLKEDDVKYYIIIFQKDIYRDLIESNLEEKRNRTFVQKLK